MPVPVPVPVPSVDRGVPSAVAAPRSGPSGSDGSSAAVAAAPAPAAASRRSMPVPSMPSLPVQALRQEPEAQAPRVTPVQPLDGVSGRTALPPADAPWQTRMTPPSTGPDAPRDPRKPADRQYVAFPIEGDDPLR